METASNGISETPPPAYVKSDIAPPDYLDALQDIVLSNGRAAPPYQDSVLLNTDLENETHLSDQSVQHNTVQIPSTPPGHQDTCSQQDYALVDHTELVASEESPCFIVLPQSCHEAQGENVLCMDTQCMLQGHENPLVTSATSEATINLCSGQPFHYQEKIAAREQLFQNNLDGRLASTVQCPASGSNRVTSQQGNPLEEMESVHTQHECEDVHNLTVYTDTTSLITAPN